jgi:tryptophan 2,3-dioxygenase
MSIAAAAAPAMHPTQARYIAARALYEDAAAEAQRRCPAPAQDAPEAEVEAWLEASEAADLELGVSRLMGELVAAEDAMLAWSLEVARKSAGRSRVKLGMIATLERGLPRHHAIRAKAIDLALRLAA